MKLKMLMISRMLTSVVLMGSGLALAETEHLHQYVIEREIPGASELSADELTAISRKSRDVLESLGPNIQWQHSYVAEDKLYCVYKAPSKDLIEQHAKQGGFPANRISRVSTVIDPGTADRPLQSEEQ